MKITLIGAGNVGSHLSKALFEAGHKIDLVYSRTLQKAQLVADRVNSIATNKLTDVPANTDLIILAVKDDDIGSVGRQLAYASTTPIAHTSGSVSSEVLADFKHFGVFYPLQTFSTHKPINFEEVPLCIFGNSPEFQETLKDLATSVSGNVRLVDDKAREILHLGAVLVNNFSNYLFMLAEDLCQSKGLDFEILKPLIRETVSKLDSYSPSKVQTGPAVRNDQKTILKHLTLLDDHPNEKAMYSQITALIYNRFK